MRVALVDIYPDSNKGACALTWACIDLVSRAFPEAELALVPITVTPPDPRPFRHTAARYPRVTILPSLFDGRGESWPRQLWRLARGLVALQRLDRHRRHADPTLEWLRGCDLVVAGGGVIFHTCVGSFRNDAAFLVRVVPLLAARRLALPTVLLGQQLGPYRSRFGHWLARRVTTQAALILARDRTSLGSVSGHPSPGQVRLLPDSALALRVPRGTGPALLARRGLDPLRPTLALAISSSLRTGERRDAHVALFAHLGRGLLAAGVVHQVVVVLQSDEDDAISRDLVAALGLAPRCFIDDDLDAYALSALYGACRMMVSSRMHGVLLALLAGVPAISLAPEVTFKERAVLGLLGLEALWVPASAGPERALLDCLAIAAQDAGHREAVGSAVAAARARWDEVPAELRALAGLGRPRPTPDPAGQRRAVPPAE